jgi:hypothetical protein
MTVVSLTRVLFSKMTDRGVFLKSSMIKCHRWWWSPWKIRPKIVIHSNPKTSLKAAQKRVPTTTRVALVRLRQRMGMIVAQSNSCHRIHHLKKMGIPKEVISMLALPSNRSVINMQARISCPMKKRNRDSF